MPFETLPQMKAQALGRSSLFHFSISSAVGLRDWNSFHSIIGFLLVLCAGIMEPSASHAYSSPFPLSFIRKNRKVGPFSPGFHGLLRDSYSVGNSVPTSATAATLKVFPPARALSSMCFDQ